MTSSTIKLPERTGTDGRGAHDASQSADCVNFPGWRACVRGGTLTLFLSGDWALRNEGSRARTPGGLPEHSNVGAIVFDSSDLGSWDSSLLIFLSSLREMASRQHIDFDQSGLPAATRR